MIQYQVVITVDEKGRGRTEARILRGEDANEMEQSIAGIFDEHTRNVMKFMVDFINTGDALRGTFTEDGDA